MRLKLNLLLLPLSKALFAVGQATSMRTRILYFILIMIAFDGTAQITERAVEKPPDTVKSSLEQRKLAAQKDLIDIMAYIVKSRGLAKHNTPTAKTGRLHFSVAPGLGYTLSTGFAAIIASNSAFYTWDH